MSYMLEALSGSVQASALDLSQNGIATLEFQDQHRRLYHVTTLLVGRLGEITTKGAGGSTHCQDNMLPRRECFLRIERALHRFCHKPSEGLARSVVLSHHSRAKVLRSLVNALAHG